MSKISVIMPVYNTIEYLRDCVGSILNQSYKNIEVILIDDGSTDGSGERCDELASIDSRIIVYHKKNEGQGIARNVGLDVATGDYFFFADSDDIVESDALEELLRLGQEENSDLVVGGYFGYGLKGKVRWSEIPNGVFTKSGREMMECNQQGIPWSLVWGKLYHSSLWENLRFPEKQLYEDSWIMPHIYFKSKRMTTYPRNVYQYYERVGSTMHKQYKVEQVQGKLKLFNHLAELYKDENMWKFAEQYSFYYIGEYMKYDKKSNKEFDVHYHKHVIWVLFSSKVSVRGRLRIIKYLLFKSR